MDACWVCITPITRRVCRHTNRWRQHATCHGDKQKCDTELNNTNLNNKWMMWLERQSTNEAKSAGPTKFYDWRWYIGSNKCNRQMCILTWFRITVKMPSWWSSAKLTKSESMCSNKLMDNRKNNIKTQIPSAWGYTYILKFLEFLPLFLFELDKSRIYRAPYISSMSCKILHYDHVDTDLVVLEWIGATEIYQREDTSVFLNSTRYPFASPDAFSTELAS
jgi:hypothetical protein